MLSKMWAALHSIQHPENTGSSVSASPFAKSFLYALFLAVWLDVTVGNHESHPFYHPLLHETFKRVLIPHSIGIASDHDYRCLNFILFPPSQL